MRFLTLSLLSALFSSVVIAETPATAPSVPGELPGSQDEAVVSKDPAETPTIFNGVEVPPLPEIDGEKFNATVKEGYWFVKHHS